MKLVDLVTFFRNGGSFDEFCGVQSIDPNSEAVEIYMKKETRLESDLAFFGIEKTEGKVKFEENEIKYFYLFDFYYFLDAISESKQAQNKSLTDIAIAKHLFSYAINDA